MRTSERVVAGLKANGDLWEAAPGLIGLRGETRARFRDIDSRLAMQCRLETRDEWSVPQALPMAVLERADYFTSFPQWLTLASHFSDDTTRAARAALPPAVCYHVYAALADSAVAVPRIVTAQGCCWRNEADQFAPLERGWAFTMRELVCIGTEAECVAFRDRGIAIARAFAERLGTAGELVAAEDPFFAPSRGRQLLQRLKELKQELRLPIGGGDTVAADSFNLHERFFGEAFDIRLPDGTPAFTACVAFGLERWLLAFLVAEHIEALAEVGA